MRVLFFLCVLCFGTLLGAQVPDSLMQSYEYRIQQDYLNDVYIPTDVDEAIMQLDELIDSTSKAKYAAQSEDVAHTKLHFSFGRWMIHNWSFYQGSRLSHFLRGKGVSYPDDMAKVLMRAYHRKLNDQPLQLDSLYKHYEEERLKSWSERHKSAVIDTSGE